MPQRGLQIPLVVSIRLWDILAEIKDGDHLFWSILYMRAIAYEGEANTLPCQSIPLFEALIDESLNGLSDHLPGSFHAGGKDVSNL